MPKQEKYVPKHRSAPARPQPVESSRKALRAGAVWGTVAVAATGTTIGAGVLASGSAASTDDLADSITASASLGELPETETSGASGLPELPERQAAVSRSDRRGEADPEKAASLAPVEAKAVTGSEDISEADPRDIARALLPEFGFSASEFGCLDALYVSESDWRIDADNPTSSAYGIPQALTELHDLPADYMTSAEAQIRWGLGYIQDSYGTPCNAWSFKQANNWY